MKKILMMVIMSVMLTAPTICAANGWQDAQNNIGTDKAAHFGCSYVINYQLHRYTNWTPLQRFIAVAAVGAIKEGLIDDHWDGRDFAADCAGALVYEVKF